MGLVLNAEKASACTDRVCGWGLVCVCVGMPVCVFVDVFVFSMSERQLAKEDLTWHLGVMTPCTHHHTFTCSSGGDSKTLHLQL